MESHLDDHYADYPEQLPVRGQIVGIVYRDDPDNPTEEITLYRVKAFLTRPNMSVLLGQPIACVWDCAGCGAERHRTLVEGQFVWVSFAEGDQNLPMIVGTVPYAGDDDTKATSLAPTRSEGLVDRDEFAGFYQETDKDGNRTLKLSENKRIEIQDSAGSKLFEIYHDGANYRTIIHTEVELGGVSGRSLVDERLTSALNLIFSAATDSNLPSFKAAIVAGLNSVFTANVTTSRTKAK